MIFKNYKIPTLEGKTIIVTGANSGIGFYVAQKFTQLGAQVILACRNKERAIKAVETIRKNCPNGKANCKYIHLDLNNFDSIKKFAETINTQHPTIDILIHNAGVIMQTKSCQSKNGFDCHIATNCLGPFLLTLQLLDNLKNSKQARIITVSSLIEKLNIIKLNKFAKKETMSWLAYTQSKTANLILSYELDRRLKKADIKNIKAVASHPGLTVTNSCQLKGFIKKFIHSLSMPIEQGAMSLIIAATSDKLKGGEYIGFDGILSTGGTPSLNKSSKITYNKKVAKQLWKKCEELTNCKY